MYVLTDTFEISSTLILVLIPIAIVQFILFVTALVSAIRKEVPASDKLLWILIIVFVSTIGPIVYFAVGSSMLDKKAAELEEAAERGQQ